MDTGGADADVALGTGGGERVIDANLIHLVAPTGEPISWNNPDSGNAGMEVADKAMKAFFGQGRKATLCVPDLGDFNDVLNQENSP